MQNFLFVPKEYSDIPQRNDIADDEFTKERLSLIGNPLEISDKVPDEKTVWSFRERVTYNRFRSTKDSLLAL